MGSEGAEDHCG